MCGWGSVKFFVVLLRRIALRQTKILTRYEIPIGLDRIFSPTGILISFGDHPRSANGTAALWKGSQKIAAGLDGGIQIAFTHNIEYVIRGGQTAGVTDKLT